MRSLLATVAAATLLAQMAIAAPPGPEGDSRASEIELALSGQYPVSQAAMATAVRGTGGAPVGIAAYGVPMDAVKAGDMAAFITMVRLASETADGGGPAGLSGVILAVDAIAAGDHAAARKALQAHRETPYEESLADFVDAWIYAMEGDAETALEAHRDMDSGLPGLTADLSLASLLEAAGRNDEALAVYEAMTPARIEAPDHEFDAKGIMFAHVQMVVARRTLLLRRLGRIEEAKEVYRKLAEAEPEQAVRYAAAMESLETGRGLDDEALTPVSAFARAFSDLSMSLWQQRLIRNAMMGMRVGGLDEERATLEQLALLIDPANEGLRENVIGMLQQEALFEGAAHVARSAPEATAGLQVSAAQSYLWARQPGQVRTAIDAALDVAEPDERLAVVSGAVGLLALLGDEDRAIALAGEAMTLAQNPAEAAMAAGLKSEILRQFGRLDEAITFARRALEADDTHGRRMALANLLGAAGEVDEGLTLIRRERLKRPNDPYMLNTLGYFLISHTDRLDEGYRILFQSNAMARNDPYIADSLGWAYFKLGHLEDALRMIELSRRELAPQKHWEIEHHLGDLYWHLGRREAAREAWTAALDEFPPYRVAQEIRAKIESGIAEPAPERRPLPRVSLDEGGTTQRKT